MDKPGGCSPLVVNFTNRTTGASPNAVYKWDFGNSNSSALFNASSVYSAEQSYTVTLTVQDGSNSSTSTQQVTVYSPPVVDFTVAPGKTCLGMPVTFTSNSTAGSGNIATYSWDFGDGSTQQGYTASQSYTYGVEQVATVSLTVTNNFGCHTTVSKPDIVKIIPALTAAFTADKRVLCLVSDPVIFTNTSTGPGTLDYTWNFDDGNVSTQKSPTHTFNKKGNYAVSVKVHSSEGCTMVATQVNPLNVANYTTDIGIPTPICKGAYVNLTDRSSPAPDASVWTIDGSPVSYYYGGVSWQFNTIGDHTISLQNTFGTCPQTKTVTVSVKDLPYPTGFTAAIQGKCGAPVAVKLNDPTPGAVKSEWDFNYYSYYPPNIILTGASPTVNYINDGSYQIYLRVTNADGCTNSITQTVVITRPYAGINAGTPTLSSCSSLMTNTFSASGSEPLTVTNWSFGDGGTSTAPNPTHVFKNAGIYTVTLNYVTQNGCTGSATFTQYSLPAPNPVTITTDPANPVSCVDPIKVTFKANSTDPLVTTNWTLGDNATSSDPSPVHTYVAKGHYSPFLNYVTAAGCKGGVLAPVVVVDPKIQVDFTPSPVPVCGSNSVSFITTPNISDINSWNWDFGDGGINYSSANPSYSYSNTGTFTVKLYARNIGGCDTSISKTVTVNPPFPKISTHTNTCDGTRGEVTFTQTSIQATTVTWNFGDGTTQSSPGTQGTMKHVYTKTGTYQVSLTAVNGQCTLVYNYPYTVYVLLKQKPILTGSKTSACSNTPVDIQVAQLENNPYQSANQYQPYYYAGYYFTGTQYGDGTNFDGTRSDAGYLYRWTTTYNATLNGFKTGEQNMRMIMKSYAFGCDDTTNFMPLAIKGAVGGFQVLSDKLCYQSPVVLQDTSHSTPDNTILSWYWDFGDGQNVTNKKGGNVSHVYANPGGYYVNMQITDAAGCSSGTAYSQFVVVKGPKASFSPSGTDVHLNTTVYFYNTTNDYGNSNTVYSWDFGDGFTSTDINPVHTYAIAGTYTVKMTATNPSLPCGSTAIPVTIIVRNFNSAFSFNSSYLAGSCPPLLVSFVNTSYNYISVSWDFGDGITAGNVNYPSHIYKLPGKYIVTLNVLAYNGITGKYIDSILIREPVVTLGAPPPPSCVGSTIELSSTAQYASSYSWDFGDGSILNSANGNSSHQYLTPGVYKATLLMKNDAGCVTDTTLQQAVTIHPNPVATVFPVSPLLCLGAPLQLEASGASVYQWSPPTGLSDPAIANPVASPTITTDYILTVKDDIGCQNTKNVTVTVIQKGILKVSPDDTVCSGQPAQLTASGEEVYQWINNTTGLSNTGIPNPVALAPETIIYTVKGSDVHSCFTDQKDIVVTVRPLPTVSAGPDILVQAGYDATLYPTGSDDVVSWKWLPEKYLSCYNCATPLCTPLATTPYILTVKNQYGCKASDTMVVAVDCQESHVRVPNAFTPNGDGENDVFVVKGISIIKHMVIYGRWGEKVYERNDFIAGDRSSCWDGSYHGQKCLPGTYVYFIEMECPSGGTFSRKGSFVLIR